MAKTARRQPRIGLALAGGGSKGAVYEIGALRALEEAVEGLDFNDLHAYVGVSAGGFVSACLANGLSPSQLCRGIMSAELGEYPFKPETFLTPAFGEFAGRAATVPRLFYEALRDYFRHPDDLSLLEAMTRLGRALPVGLFDNEPIRVLLHNVLSREGRTDDFRQLGKKLVIVAADLNSGQAVRFGEAGFDHVPISRAVQASSALPGLFPPVEIEGRAYVDGVLLKTLHASVALEAGAELVLCINPIVPVDTARAVEQGVMRRGKLVDRGLGAVLSQTFRTLIRSRLQAGMKVYDSLFEGTDVVLLEPRRDDYRMFFTNIFSFSERRAVCEHAYQRTRKNLLDRRGELGPVFERHGLTLRLDVLEDEGRDLWAGVGLADPQPAGRARGPEVLERLDRTLDRLEAYLDRESEGAADPSRDERPKRAGEAEPLGEVVELSTRRRAAG